MDHRAMKRITVFENGTRLGGRALAVPPSLDELRQSVNTRLGLADEWQSVRLFTAQGGELDDIALVRDNDVLYASASAQAFVAPRCCGAVSPAAGTEVSSGLSAAAGADWLTLNVGGRLFTTTRSTLTSREPAGMLALMFGESGGGGVADGEGAGRPWHSAVDASGAYLFDRSPRYFAPLLDFLRHGTVVLDDGVDPRGVLEEARFFGVTALADAMETRIAAAAVATDGAAITRRELVLRLLATPANCELRCQGINFAKADLSRLDLRYINFKYAILRGANMAGANLSWCNFERADLSGATLDGACLLGARLLCANLQAASLQACNFEDPAGSRANMEGANLKQVNLEGSHMAGVNLRVATLQNANLQNCDLRGAVLAGADLMNCDLSGCDLQEANLRGANFQGAAFELMVNPLHMSQTVR